MKTLIIYESVHHGNTEKIAKAMAGILEADLLKPDEIDAKILLEYDLIGFGSGIYFGKHHKRLLAFIDSLPKLNKKAFIFSTKGGTPTWLNHKKLKKKLSEKGFDIVKEFSCKGFDTFGMLKYIGGINKNRPNEEDLEKAKIFAKELSVLQPSNKEIN